MAHNLVRVQAAGSDKNVSTQLVRQAVAKVRGLLLHLPVSFAGKDRAGPEHRGPLAQPHGVLSSLLRRPRAVEQTLRLTLQVAQTIGLQPVRQGAKQEMTVSGRWPAECGTPT